jgi:cytochrome d ubiquinol oxidase subunit II
MHTAWFCFLAVMVTIYVVLDGFDLGVGALHLVLARNEEEREQATAAIGPVWNGNEVWLLASGGVLFMAFPKAYASAFSGLYFGLIIVLWLLVGRGLALELRHQLDNPLWRSACDAVFCLSSAALALVFGVALGNVVRGVPLGPDGYFGLTLFEILNWYGLLIGVFGLVTLCAHGAHFLAWRATGDLADRARRRARQLWATEAVLFVALIAPTVAVRDEMLSNLTDHPWTLIFPLLAVGSLAAMFVMQRAGRWLHAFIASGLFIAGMLTTMAAGLYPNVLPAHDGSLHSLTIDNVAAGDHTLQNAIVWWPVGMVLAAVYFALAYRFFFRAGPPRLAGAHSETSAAGGGGSSQKPS